MEFKHHSPTRSCPTCRLSRSISPSTNYKQRLHTTFSSCHSNSSNFCSSHEPGFWGQNGTLSPIKSPFIVHPSSSTTVRPLCSCSMVLKHVLVLIFLVIVLSQLLVVESSRMLYDDPPNNSSYKSFVYRAYSGPSHGGDGHWSSSTSSSVLGIWQISGISLFAIDLKD